LVVARGGGSELAESARDFLGVRFERTFRRAGRPKTQSLDEFQ
jgi:hypothetical protein